jgi:hypothetical protein
MSSSSQRFSAQTSAAGSQLSPDDQFIGGHRVLKLADINQLAKVILILTYIFPIYLSLYIVNVFYYFTHKMKLLLLLSLLIRSNHLTEDGTFLDALPVLNRLMALLLPIHVDLINTRLRFPYSGGYINYYFQCNFHLFNYTTNF